MDPNPPDDQHKNMREIFWIVLLLTIPSIAFSSALKVVSLSGQILDAETGDPVAYAYLHMEEINRTATSDREGRFELNNLPQGTYSLFIHRIGYTDQKRTIHADPDDPADLEIILQPSTLSGRTIEIVGRPGELRGSHLEDASITVLGMELRKNLGTTLSETLSSQPGFAQRSMGAAPSRPVIRGLGDSRVLILQDGERTGDVSYTSADHAVTIDPITANEIEIARGPAALAYGSNAIGGVINVVRDQIPTSRRSNMTGGVSLQGSSVNNGISGSGNVKMPLSDDFMLNLDLNGRYGQNYSTPSGKLDNSFLQSTNSAAAMSYIRPWGYTGVAFTAYLSNYGIPPDPEGGHPAGVDIDMSRFQVDSRSEFIFEDRFLNNMEAQFSYRYYNHREYETETIVGTEYTANTVNATLKARHKGFGILNEGTIGIWGEFQDYFVYDRFNLDANSYSASAFVIQRADPGNFQLDLGLRLDANAAHPARERPEARIGHIRQRTYLGLASSASLVYDFGRGFQGGGTIMHSFRPPTLDELYSEGPHIAAYSFEIGNPDLEPERGLGTELYLRHKSSRSVIRTSLFRNSFSNYIYPRNTGRPNIIFPDLNDYQYVAVEALMYGFEAAAEVRLTGSFSVDGMIGYTIGERKVDDGESESSGIDGSTTPLPMIPPLSASVGATWAPGLLSIGSRLRYSAAQDRLGEFETMTDAFTIWDVHAQYRFTHAGLLHTVALRIDNLLNEEYFNHLSRIKELFPEPGRNFNVLYRVYF